MQRHLKNDLLYLLRILESVEKILLYAHSYESAVDFFEVNEGKEYNACLMMLVQIGEEAGKLSDELKENHFEIDWKEMKGFRNRVVHEYTGLDRFITFDIIKQQIPLLKPQIELIIQKEIIGGNFDEREFEVATKSPYLKHVDFKRISNK